MKQRTTGSRLNLGEPLDSDLSDFCVAHFNAPAINIVREAIRELMERRLASEPEMRKRFEEARKTRLKAQRGHIQVVKPTEN
jgi:hypothetical protein